MNLFDVLTSRFDPLPEGEYRIGLKSVLQHILIAQRHLFRGQTEADDTAFTDAIYRTNQAFEGSLKEAYRVLTAKDPSKETPNSIEKYFQDNTVLRPRVLSQFTNYRQQWRNPSTHDHRLDFDEDEALLAIVSVSAFAIVLIDQITERIAYVKSKDEADRHPPIPATLSQPLLEQVSSLLEHFALTPLGRISESENVREAEVLGALAGYLASTAPHLEVVSGVDIKGKASERLMRADLLISSDTDKLIMELKVNQDGESGLTQLATYLSVTGIPRGILFQYGAPNKGVIEREKVTWESAGTDVVIIRVL